MSAPCSNCGQRPRAARRSICEACRNGPDDLTVDRIEAGTRGQPGPYCETNIAILTRSENAVKGNREKAARWNDARQIERRAA